MAIIPSVKKAAPKTKPANPTSGMGNVLNREEQISVAAYFRAEKRGFTGGDPTEDWLAAEAEIDAGASAI
jgi:hypothetical protein